MAVLRNRCDLIGATHIPVAPRLIYKDSPDHILLGLSTARLGRIQCAPGYTNKTIYVTIVDGQDQPCAKTAQSTNQHFCMVQMSSMEKSFMLVEYPNLRKVLKATDLSLDNGGTKLVVGELDENITIVNGGKLPRDFGKEYQYSLVQAGALVGSETLLYFIFADQTILGVARRVIQTGKIPLQKKKMHPSFSICLIMKNGSTFHLNTPSS